MFYFVKNIFNDKEDEMIGQALKCIKVNYSFFYREEVYVNMFERTGEKISAINLD